MTNVEFDYDEITKDLLEKIEDVPETSQPQQVEIIKPILKKVAFKNVQPIVKYDFFNVGKYNIPKQTVFMSIALIVIGIIIYKISNKSEEKKNH